MIMSSFICHSARTYFDIFRAGKQRFVNEILIAKLECKTDGPKSPNAMQLNTNLICLLLATTRRFHILCMSGSWLLTAELVPFDERLMLSNARPLCLARAKKMFV